MSISRLELKAQAAGKTKKFNVDLLAITIALTLATLIRLNIIPHVGF